MGPADDRTATADARPGGVRPGPGVEPLLREVLGRRLRILRQERAEPLARTARRAGVSPQYLSEVERGIKEPSSEMIAAIAGALGTGLLDLTVGIARDLHDREAGTRTATGLRTATGPGIATGLGTATGLRTATESAAVRVLAVAA